MLCDLKLSPAKEKAAVKEVEVLGIVVGEAGFRLDALVEDGLLDLLFTDN